MSMQMARLFEIVQILLNEKDVTTKKLAKHFEISVRTVYRDIEALMFAGIPIYSERGKNGGIRLMEDYVMDRALISDKDQNEILYALQSLKALNYPDNNKIVSKLNSIFNRKSTNKWIEVEFSKYGDNDNTLFENIKEAILDKRIINFRYYNTKGEKDDRIVEPLKIWFKEKAWYLFAYCHTKKDIRQFKINRIKELVLTERNFERSIEEFNINNKNDKLNGVKIKVEIDKSQAYRVYDEFCEENIIKKENGDFEVLMENYENDWLYGYLLSYGEHLRILEPERIKNIILEKIVKIKYKYEK